MRSSPKFYAANVRKKEIEEEKEDDMANGTEWRISDRGGLIHVLLYSSVCVNVCVLRIYSSSSYLYLCARRRR